MEQIIDWLNENELRAYPLLDTYNNREFVSSEGRQIKLPDNFILDLQLTVTDFDLGTSINSGTARAAVPVYLKRVQVAASNLLITFGTQSQTKVSFSVPALIDSTPRYFRKSSGDLLVVGEGASVFLDMVDGEFVDLAVPVEPCVVTQFNGPWLGVSSISTSPEKQTVAQSYKPQLPLVAVPTEDATSLTGDITFLEGYNFRVRVNSNLIDLGIAIEYGLNMRCDTAFLNSEYLDCSELVSYVNGVGPDSIGNLTLKPGANITITNGNLVSEEFTDFFDEQANAHTLFVGLSFKQNDLCSPVILKPE